MIITVTIIVIIIIFFLLIYYHMSIPEDQGVTLMVFFANINC